MEGSRFSVLEGGSWGVGLLILSIPFCVWEVRVGSVYWKGWRVTPDVVTLGGGVYDQQNLSDRRAGFDQYIGSGEIAKALWCPQLILRVGSRVGFSGE